MSDINAATQPKPTDLFQRLGTWYLFLLISWFVLFLVFGDGSGYLGLINSLAIYLFVPLPVLLLFAWRVRDRKMFAAGLLGLGIFAFLWGPLFWPQTVEVEGPRLRVMTLNVLGRSGNPDEVLTSIKTENPDVLFLQEVTAEIAPIFIGVLSEEYPYQVIDERPKAGGMAVFSRYPLQRIDISLGGEWRGNPQLLSLNWEGRQITLVNFHPVSTATVWPRWVDYTYRLREDSIARLAEFVSGENGPLIVAGDANFTRLNDSYQLLDAQLNDAWWQAGWGFGHTFPAGVEADDLFARVSFFLIPHWVVRIDHVFYSADWQASRTWLAEFNGGSDHRGVVTELILIVD